jgi:hypothetical protein
LEFSYGVTDRYEKSHEGGNDLLIITCRATMSIQHATEGGGKLSSLRIHLLVKKDLIEFCALARNMLIHD